LDPGALDQAKLHQLLEMTCLSDWYNTKIRDTIVSLIQDKGILNRESKHDHLTILQKLASVEGSMLVPEDLKLGVGKRCEFLIRLGADPNQHHRGTDPFIVLYAIRHPDDSAFISSLINERGVNPETTDNQGRGLYFLLCSIHNMGGRPLPAAGHLFKPVVSHRVTR
jgi:hypothetical protein